MNHKLFFVLVLFGIIIFSGCSESKTNPESIPTDFKEIIAYMKYIDRVESDGQRTMVVIVSPTATKKQVQDLCDFLINDTKENKIWLEVWDDLATLQKGRGITEADKVAHYIVYVVADKSAGKKDYFWERKYS